MKKRDFNKWALTQPDFKTWEGELYWFGFKFWDLDKACQVGVVNEFKSTVV